MNKITYAIVWAKAFKEAFKRHWREVGEAQEKEGRLIPRLSMEEIAKTRAANARLRATNRAMKAALKARTPANDKR